MTLFPHTHRVDLQGRTFAQALSDVLGRLGFTYASDSESFHAQPLMRLQQCCHALDTQEAQQRATPAMPSALEAKLSSLAKEVASLKGTHTRGRASSQPTAAALEPGTRPQHPSSPARSRPATSGTKPTKEYWKQKQKNKPKAEGSAVVADDPTDTVHAA
jgi:hypothetical protein